jgi:hypothetical protein
MNMMVLEMYLDEELLEVVSIGHSGWITNGHKQINSLKTVLPKKHQSRPSQTEKKPGFYLVGVASGMNSFVPLGTSRC